jgi:hypothetical protein
MRPAAFIGFIGLLAATLLVYGCSLSDSPRRSLSELKTALVNHDADKALKYIDVNSVVATFVNDLFSGGEDTKNTFGLTVVRGMANLARPAMSALVERQLRAAISSDNQWGHFDDIRRASVWYFTIAEEGDSALVEPRGKSSFYFVMKKTQPGWWRITEIKGK